MNKINLLTNTNGKLNSAAILLLRCTIGFILFYVGAGKVMGWFSGMGMEATAEAFSKHSGISAPLAYLSSYTEFLGGALLILGLLTRPVAFAIMINMLVATLVLLPKGFFTGGAGYPFTLMIVALVILLTGPMHYSIDYLLRSQSKTTQA